MHCVLFIRLVWTYFIVYIIYSCFENKFTTIYVRKSPHTSFYFKRYKQMKIYVSEFAHLRFKKKIIIKEMMFWCYRVCIYFCTLVKFYFTQLACALCLSTFMASDAFMRSTYYVNKKINKRPSWISVTIYWLWYIKLFLQLFILNTN